MSKQKTTFYTQPLEGGIEFKTSRRIGDVRIPNYVYDMWLPIIGSDALAIYGVYCRLEMRGFVKKITLAKIAKTCRIGTRKLSRINEMLAECGFAIITVPTGQARLSHWTTCIEVLDPPQKIPQTIIDKYCPKGYEILTPWLKDESQTTLTEKPNDISGEVKRHLDEVSDDISMIESLELEPLNVETKNFQEENSPNGKPKLDPALHMLQVQSSGITTQTATADDQFWGPRDKALKLHAQYNSGREPTEAERVKIVELTESPFFDLALLETSYIEAGANRSPKYGKPPIARVIEVYEAGGDYSKFAAKKWPKEEETDGKPTDIKPEQREKAKALAKLYG